MATQRRVVCAKCNSSTDAGALFDALQLLSSKAITPCPTCATDRQLHLEFDFGLDAGGKDSAALAAFLPRKPQSWTDSKGREVTFFPFLVITERGERERAVWMPYWHIVRDGKKRISKYGQWAPYMDLDLFADLIDQAADSGLLEIESRV